MFGIGMPELIIILIIILIIFGAGKLPEIGSGIGKGIKTLCQLKPESLFIYSQLGKNFFFLANLSFAFTPEIDPVS